MAERIKLEVVDDPVTGPAPSAPVKETTPVSAAADNEPSAPPPRPPRSTAGGREGADERSSDSQPAYGQEQKKAVFGRVPRSLSRRLERAVVELRDEFEDLTQEQVLAALLHAHVDPTDQAALARLTDTVRRYRGELHRR